ncbi:MAG TPA: outer membrane lipoprotein-sorting protein [Chthonomonadaceae bacterium]|nr:outer membrane lipoprotein-sorting protein [Chthonomonadaceae bacterium]
MPDPGILSRARKPGGIALGVCIGILFAAGWGRVGAAPPGVEAGDIARFTTHIQDLETSVKVTECDPSALEKIGPDFQQTYAIRNLTFLYKNPDKIRIEGHSPTLGTALMILNGPTRYYSVPRLRMKKTEDLQSTPSRRQSLLEYGGLLSADTLRFMKGRYVGQETLDGSPADVFDLTYQGLASSSHYRLWIDPKTDVTLKRAWYDLHNTLKATFYYQESREICAHVWLPSRIEVKNADGATAAVTTLSDVKVNQGLPDSLFSISR